MGYNATSMVNGENRFINIKWALTFCWWDHVTLQLAARQRVRSCFRQFLAEILLVSRQDERFTAAAKPESAVTVKLDFGDPIARGNWIDELCLHRLHNAGQLARRGGISFHASGRRFGIAWVLIMKFNTTTRRCFDRSIDASLNFRFNFRIDLQNRDVQRSLPEIRPDGQSASWMTDKLFAEIAGLAAIGEPLPGWLD
jgi:hypothetical protein